MAGGREQARGDSLTFEILGSRQGLVTKSQAARDAARSLAKSSSSPSPRTSPIYVLDSGSTATIRAEPASPYDAIQPVLKVSSANRKPSPLTAGVPTSSSGPLVPTSHSNGVSPHAGGVSAGAGGYYGSSQLSSSTSSPSPTALVGGRPLSARGSHTHSTAAGLAAATYLGPGTAQHGAAAATSGGAQTGAASNTGGTTSSTTALGRRPNSAPLQMYMSHGSGARSGSTVPASSAAISQLGQGPGLGGHVASVPSALTAIAGSQGTRHGSLGAGVGNRLTRSQSARESSINHSLAVANGNHATGPVRPLSASVAQSSGVSGSVATSGNQDGYHSSSSLQQPRPASAGSLQPHAPTAKHGSASNSSSNWVASVRNRLLGVRAAGGSKDEAQQLQQSPRQKAGNALARSLSAGAAVGSSLDAAVGSSHDLLMRMFQHLQGATTAASPASPTEPSDAVRPLSSSSPRQAPGGSVAGKGSTEAANTSTSSTHVSASSTGSNSTLGINPRTARLPSGSATGPSSSIVSPPQPQAPGSIAPSAPGGSAPQVQRPGRLQQQQQQTPGHKGQATSGTATSKASSSASATSTNGVAATAGATTTRPGTPALTSQQLSKQQAATASGTPQGAATAAVTPGRPGSGRKQLSLDMSKIKNPLEAGGARIVALSSTTASSYLGSPGSHNSAQGPVTSPAASSSSPSPSARAARLEATVSPLAAKAATAARGASRAGAGAAGIRGFRHEGGDEGGVRSSLTYALLSQGVGFEVPVPLTDIGTTALLPGGVYAAAAQRSSKVMCDVMAATSELAGSLGLDEPWILRVATSRVSL